ncbi:MAG: branched-chain amino acid ABC transporter permease [Candidatus Aerophobetes bacterium]|nr:branched-chain amino acid ABC transporter permease [Candidatus Aerophobetes bacterium]
MIMTFLFALLAASWNILGGFTGYVSFGHAVFFGLGAYSVAVLGKNFAVNPWLGSITGALVAIGLASIIAFPSFQTGLRAHYFAIATWAVGEVIRVIFMNWMYVGGATGIMIPLTEPSLLNYQYHTNKVPYYYIIFSFLVLEIVLIYFITKSRFGYYLRAIKGNEEAAENIGINTTLFKHLAYYLSATFVAIGGAFYAQYELYFDPPMVFHVGISMKMILPAILGGIGTICGPIIGAAIMIPLDQFLRAYLGGIGSGINFIIYGLLVLIVVVFKPKGIYEFIGNLFKKGKGEQ